MDRVAVLDTTLRDGEQAPGIALGCAAKVCIAEGLVDLQTDIIEAGFPASSAEEQDAVSQIAQMSVRRGFRGRITALSRCTPDDIATTAQALRHAQRPRLHLVLSTSDRHRRVMHPGQSDAELLALVARSVAQARGLVDDVQFSAQDSSRTDPDFLVTVARTARDAGASVFNICDTVGYAVPDEFAALVRAVVSAVPDIVCSVHCHNDLGLAVANSLAGLAAGARQVEVAVNGIGERAGNCSYEEVVMVLRTRGAAVGLTTGIEPVHLSRVSALVAELTDYPVAPNKAVVGDNAFAHESGMHQHGVLADRQTYEIMRAEDIGRAGGRIVLGKHSGRHALRAALESLAVHIDESQLREALRLLKSNPEYGADLRALAAAVS